MPDPKGRTPEKHDGRARGGWHTYVYADGELIRDGFLTPPDPIMKTGVKEDGEVEPKAKRPRAKGGIRMTKARREEIARRAAERLRRKRKEKGE